MHSASAEIDPKTGALKFRLSSAQVVEERTSVQIIDDAKAGQVIVSNPSGVGSGFLIDKEGRIVTNYHVVRNEKFHKVTFFTRQGKVVERKELADVELIAVSPLYDLALLRVDLKKAEAAGITLRPLTLSSAPSVLEPGDPVICIGNPGIGGQILDQSVSEGIVSSSARNVGDLLYVQTTAAVNPGNSGGPLLNANGEVVGVVTLKAFFKEGIAFALPVRYLRDFLENQKAFALDNMNSNSSVRYLKPE